MKYGYRKIYNQIKMNEDCFLVWRIEQLFLLILIINCILEVLHFLKICLIWWLLSPWLCKIWKQSQVDSVNIKQKGYLILNAWSYNSIPWITLQNEAALPCCGLKNISLWAVKNYFLSVTTVCYHDISSSYTNKQKQWYNKTAKLIFRWLEKSPLE